MIIGTILGASICCGALFKNERLMSGAAGDSKSKSTFDELAS